MPSTYKGIPNNTNPSWWLDNGLRWNVLWVAVTATFQVTSGYDSFLLNSLQAVPKWFEDFPGLTNPNTLGLTVACAPIPGIILPFITAWAVDRAGRKWLIILGISLVLLGNVVQTVSHQLGVFIGGRVIMGAGAAIGTVAAVPMAAELSHPRFRGQAASMQIAVFNIGGILASWVTYGALNRWPTGQWSWRLPVLFECVLPAMMLPFLFFMPESPRYLMSRGREAEARHVFAKLHANGVEDDPLVNLEVEEVRLALEAECSVDVGWSALWATKANRWRMFIAINTGCGAQLNGVGIVSYYLIPVLRTIGILSPLRQTLITGGLTIMNLFFACLGALLVEKVGRRFLWLTSTSIMLVALSIVTALSATFVKAPSSAVGGATIGFLYIFYAGFDLAWSPLNVGYTVEVLPFTIRAKGVAVWVCATYVSIVINTWVNPIALKAIGWKYYIVYIVILIYLLVVIYFYYPETRGRTLEEIAEVFEGESAHLYTTGQANHSVEDGDGKEVDLSHHEQVSEISKDSKIHH